MTKPSQNHTRYNRRGNRSLKSRQFKGIRMRKWGSWVSEIRMPHSTRRIWLGSYDSPQKAARAYDFAVYCLRGAKAKFNFPHSLPEIPCASSLSPPQIQAGAAKYAEEEFPQPPHIPAVPAQYASEEFPLPSEDVAFSSSSIQVECGQETSAFWDSVPEDLDCGGPLPLEDFPPWDVPMEEFEGSLTLEDFPPLDVSMVNVKGSLTLEDFPPLDVPMVDVKGSLILEDFSPLDVSMVDVKGSLTLEDFPPLDVLMEDFEVLFQLTENWGCNWAVGFSKSIFAGGDSAMKI